VGPDGQRRTAPTTFTTKTDADRWLAQVDLDLAHGSWLNEAASHTAFGVFARQWLEDRDIGPRWRETCERNLRLHMGDLETLPLRAITPAVVRTWYAARIRGGGGKTSLAQSYRFLRAVMNTAVADNIIAKNPCQIAGAGAPRAKKRSIATPEQILTLTAEAPGPYRAAILIAAWCGLRRGEILALRRSDLDLDAATISVHQTQTEMLATRERFDSPPKSDAGLRTVNIPAHIVPALRDHLGTYAGPTRVFVSRDGSPMRGDSLYQAFARARTRAGLERLRFHDLRHTGQTLAAATGATLADLMLRLGHSSPAAAMRYLHTVQGRDKAIAEALTVLAEHGDAARLPGTVTTK
jgi:integrase